VGEIRFKRGDESRLSTLKYGEPFVASNGKMFVGTPSGNVELAKKSDIGTGGGGGGGTGDMSKSTYDTDGDGKVNSAVSADSVAWTGVTGKPSTFAPSAHTHATSEVTGLDTVLSGKANTSDLHTHSNKSTLDKLSDNGTNLIFNGGVVENTAPPAAAPIGCRVYGTANQSLPASTSTLVSFDAERFDTDNMHTTSPNGRITFNTAGYYIVGANIQFSANASGVRMVSIKRNGTKVIGEQALGAVSSSIATSINVSTIYYFNAGDYVECYAYQSSISSITINRTTDETSPEFYAMRIGG
jgi:hypothetical protein